MHTIIYHSTIDKMAGIERVLLFVADLLQKREESFSFLISEHTTEVLQELSDKSYHVDFLFETSHFKQIFKFGRYIGRLPSNDVRVIASNPVLASTAYLGSKLTTKDVSIVSCEHFSISKAGKVSKLLRKLLYRRFTVITLTEGDKHIIEKLFKPSKCFCIPNASPVPISTEDYPQQSKIIIAVGRMIEQKGFDLLLQAWKGIFLEYQDWTLNIIGDDYGQRKELHDFIVNNKMNNVHLLQASRNIFSIYKRASFFVLSSRFEGLPMVLIEAQASGLPIVAFDCPTGPRELIKNGENGLLVANGNVKELEAGIRFLIDNGETRKEFSDAAKCLAENYKGKSIEMLWNKYIFDVE